MIINGAQNGWLSGITGLNDNVRCNINCYRNNVGCHINEGNIYIDGEAKIDDKPVKDVYVVGTDWDTFIKILQEKGELKDVVIENGQIVTDPKRQKEIKENAEKNKPQMEVEMKKMEQDMQKMTQDMLNMQQQTPLFYTTSVFKQWCNSFANVVRNYVNQFKAKKEEKLEPAKPNDKKEDKPKEDDKKEKPAEKKEDNKPEEPKKGDEGEKKIDEKDAEIAELKKKVAELQAKLEEQNAALSEDDEQPEEEPEKEEQKTEDKPAEKDEGKKDGEKPTQDIEKPSQDGKEPVILQSNPEQDVKPADKEPNVEEPMTNTLPVPPQSTDQEKQPLTKDDQQSILPSSENEKVNQLINQGKRLLEKEASDKLNDAADKSKDTINQMQGPKIS